jgi:hypothetical protein
MKPNIEKKKVKNSTNNKILKLIKLSEYKFINDNKIIGMNNKNPILGVGN